MTKLTQKFMAIGQTHPHLLLLKRDHMFRSTQPMIRPLLQKHIRTKVKYSAVIIHIKTILFIVSTITIFFMTQKRHTHCTCSIYSEI
jgi:hypothetical protein